MPSYYPVYPTYQTNYPSYTPQPSGILWVSGLAEAQAYPVAPNHAVALWDSAAPAIYLKQADASGRPSLKAFDLTERAVSAPAPQTGSDMGKPGNAVESALDALNSTLDDIRRDIGKLLAEKEAQT